MSGAPSWPSLEIRIKSLNYVGDLLLQKLQDFSDAESVLCGSGVGEENAITLHVHGRLNGEWVCLYDGADAPDFPRNSRVGGDALVNNRQVTMLVGIRDIPEDADPSAAFKWLQPLDRCLVRFRKRPDPITASLFPALWRTFNGKLRALCDLSRVEERQLENEIIEGGSQIVSGLTDENGNDLWNGLIRACRNGRDLISSARVCIGLEPDVRNFPLDIVDVFLCPAYS